MKINNYDVDVYLKGVEVAGKDLSLNKKESLALSKRPSLQRRHVINDRKVNKAINEINKNSDWSLYSEVEKRWSDCMWEPMTYYRGYTKSALDVFAEVDKMTKAFDEMGLRSGDHIVACMSNVPEVLTLLLTASRCGLIVNFIGDNFDKNYIRTIFENTPGKKLFIGTDDKYAKVADLVTEAGFLDKVVVSLTDSLLTDEDPYEYFDKYFYRFVNRVSGFKSNDPDIMSYSELLEISEKWDSNDNGYAKRTFYPTKDSINLPLTITYTSGTTGHPKPVVHSNKSYISMARFQDSDLSKMSAMRNVRKGLANIPTYSNVDLALCISDVICQNCTVAFEPIYDPKFLLYSMIINKPGFVAATRSHLIETAKQMEKYPDAAKVGFARAVNVVAVGEGLTKGEEIFINRSMKNAEAGSDVLPKILGTTVLSINGGDCEHGELFFTSFKSLREKLALNRTVRKDFGLRPLQSTDFAVLDENLDECAFEEYGRVVANSNSTMIGYLRDINGEFSLMDRDGRTWGDCNVWGAVLKNGNVLIKDRYDRAVELSNGQKIPYFMIAEKLMECPELMSCEIVKPCDREDALVAHIEFDPNELGMGSEWIDVLLREMEENCQDSFTEELANKIVYKIRPYDDSYPLTQMGKRSISALEKEGIKDSYKPDISGCDIVMVPAEEYFNRPVEKALQLVKKD